MIPSIWPCASNAASQAKGWLCRVWFLICIASFVFHMKQRFSPEMSPQWASKVLGRMWSNTETTHFVPIRKIIAQRHSDGIKNTLTS